MTERITLSENIRPVLACFITLFCCCAFQPIKQITLPLGGTDGVPCVRSESEGIFIDGFAVDSAENLYFTGGGEKAMICCYSLRENRMVYRKPLAVASSGELCLVDGLLYNVAQWMPGKNLRISRIAPATGQLLDTKHLVLPHPIGNTIFVAGKISLRQHQKVYKNGQLSGLQDRYTLLDLSGNCIKEMADEYNLPSPMLSNQDTIAGSQYIGMYAGKYLFYDINIHHDTVSCRFYLADGNGQILEKSPSLLNKVIGGSFNSASEGNPASHKALANGNLYMLCEKDGRAVINIFELAELFGGKQHP